ncbi:c-type cytochrome [Pseudomonas sp. RTC3]|uniref:c-type cytochrome n=2 Tax=Pseudomonas TaxID=286 RepID=UPI002AB54FE0|nr:MULTISPECIES: c-type cytochrome [unclassified Pseudomonas]MEB0065055.1 c-type cytochrome [Pseudomonas sp. RTC3]MDY7564496.1 c-type cytochrome [Pseudomonas sp. 5C2]MEB0006388.1 c-type cytochrome [Pseudomonas sp. RTB2]MEB0016145.1 c-type cytochrome [Pseudomonas sp. RTB3]MEB0145976.1 c-type cytochrome [Pseudomonas sp. CCC2.2]
MEISRWALVGLGSMLVSPGFAADAQEIFTRGGSHPGVIACSACHGADGLGMPAPGFPRLAGLPAEYLAKQISDFSSGSRANAIMYPIAKALSHDESKVIAAMLAKMPSPEVTHVNRAHTAQGSGEVLALRGAWDRNIPECVACHGPSGVGVGGLVPPLSGQSTQYLTSQLNAWRQGTRNNDPNDLMGHIARSLTDDEVEAVSKYFAELSK